MASNSQESSLTPAPVYRVAVIGMGGFAGSHHDSIYQLESQGVCQLLCTCDPDPARFTKRMGELKFEQRGIRVFRNYLDMLNECASDLDVVTIPTPVPLHAEMHQACVQRGLAVYLEKPPTLVDDELNHMLAVEGNARKQTNVGFNFIIEPQRHNLKQRLMKGEFGRVLKVVLSGLWPRVRSYYQRADWAGRLVLNDRMVLDSCMGNAMAHYVHNVLFWANLAELFSWASASSVRAELYRAHDIQGIDTVFLAAVMQNGIQLQIVLSHACAGQSRHYEQVVCEKAVITYVTNSHFQIAWLDGRVETQPIPPATLTDNLAAYFIYLNGQSNRPLTRLIDAQPFVRLNDLAYIAAGHIVAVPKSDIDETKSGDGQDEYVAIRNINAAAERFLKTAAFPSEQHLSWAKPGGTATLHDLPALRNTITTMCSEREASNL